MKSYHSSLTATIFLLLAYYCLISSLLTGAALNNIDTDRDALLVFKSQLNLESSHIMSDNWTKWSHVCSWVGITCGSQQQRVTSLDISSMGLITGFIVPQLGNLSFLVSLNLSFNNFQGNLPQELTRLQHLRFLDLRRNNFSGQLPSWFASFPKLQLLNLRNNTFSGVIPSSLSNASSLELLGLSFNRLHGGIPREMGFLQNLRVLGLAGNKLTGSVPGSLFKLPKLEILILAYNSLQGSIPREVGNSTLLRELYLSYNKLTGEIPSGLLNVSTLHVLTLESNWLTGSLPSNFGASLTNIEVLNLSGNSLTSESPDLNFITSLTNCRYLRKLEVNDNPLNGRLPPSIGNFSSSMKGIYAYNCGLHGRIPDEIGNLSNLITIALADNHLIGSFPITLANLQGLQALDVQKNKLDGTIPGTVCNLWYLFVLALNDNQFGDAIPNCLGNLTSLRILQLGNNKLNSTIPANLWSLKDLQLLDLASNFLVGSLPPEIGNLRAATQIDFSVNQFSGIIPNTIGDLNTLSNFFLNDNKFQGSIPDSIGQMVSLENLDLSHNNLSGRIPTSLEKLQHLFYFNVSFNDLSGEIPSAGPFKNFTSQSFISNKGLCGDLKYEVQPCHAITRSKRKSKLHIFLISLGSLGIILAMIFIAYVIARYQRKDRGPIKSHQWSGPTPVGFSYHEILQATDGYSESNLIGTGSFGSVYKGTLRNGKYVAVKVFKLQSEMTFNSFEVECKVLRELRHRNLCKVIGSCSNQDFKALVFEYIPAGSLEKWLYSHNYFLDILQRISIMIDIASALEYLHYGYSTTIIHCDLKPSNVLLDEQMTAHLCDFGIAKLLDDGESGVRTTMLATLGYIAPEFGLEGLVSARCDVYSYGIVLMEVFTRLKPGDETFVGNSTLRNLVKNSMPDGIIHIIDSNLLRSNEEFFRDKLSCFSSIFELALYCTVETPSERIDIRSVLVALAKIQNQLMAHYQ